MRLEAEFFLALKPSLQCHQTFVKVGFPDKVTGLRAFEGQMPYQKYQGPPIVVRWIGTLKRLANALVLQEFNYSIYDNYV